MFPGPLYCCISIKTVNKQTLSVFIDDLKIITIIVNLYKKLK